MKLLITADLHLSDSARDAYRFVFLQKTLPNLLQAHNPDVLAVLGDLTEAWDRHPARLTNAIVDGFVKLSDRREVIIIPGNHDSSDTALPFFAFLDHFPNILWVAKPSVTRVGVLFLPHSHRPWAEPLPRCKYVLAHNTFDGANERGQTLTGFPLDLLRAPTVRRAIAGDVHTPQTINNFLWYVGAPYRVDFGDEYEPRVLLLDTEKDTLRSIPVPGPQKRLIKITTLAQLKKTQVNAGDVIKVEVLLPPEEAPNFNEWIAAIRNWGDDKEVYINQIAPILDAEAKRLSRASSQREPLDDKGLVRNYAKARALAKDVEARGLEFVKSGRM